MNDWKCANVIPCNMDCATAPSWVDTLYLRFDVGNWHGTLQQEEFPAFGSSWENWLGLAARRVSASACWNSLSYQQRNTGIHTRYWWMNDYLINRNSIINIDFATVKDCHLIKRQLWCICTPAIKHLISEKLDYKFTTD